MSDRPTTAVTSSSMGGSTTLKPEIFQHSNLVVGIAFNDDLNIKLIPRPRNNADCAYAPVVTKVAGYGIYVVSSDCLKYFDFTIFNNLHSHDLYWRKFRPA